MLVCYENIIKIRTIKFGTYAYPDIDEKGSDFCNFGVSVVAQQ